MIDVEIGGLYLRVAEADWSDPLDTTFAEDRGGRWNAPGSYPVLYLNADRETARANVRAKFAGLPYGPEDLDPIDAPHLVEVVVPDGRGCDLRPDVGLAAVGLPVTYPDDGSGQVVGWGPSQAVGLEAYDRGLDGVACRSAAPGGHDELAWFPRPDRPRASAGGRFEFPDWYWRRD